MLLHYAPGSAHCASVRIALSEKALKHREHRVDLAAFEQHEPGYLAQNPQGLVPLLEDRGRRLSESFFIMLYLDETYRERPLAGSTPRERYLVQKWGKYVETHLAPNLAIVRWTKLGGKVPDGAANALQRLPQERAALWQSARQGFAADRIATSTDALVTAGNRAASDLADRDWLVGESLSLADIAVFPHLAQFAGLGVRLPQAVRRWLARAGELQSVRAIERDLFALPTMGPELGRWG